jgi:N-acetylglucosaminyldiphosphoundecaprenol N-acetyl-beta-D-mannosaminyltransferase
MSAVVHSDTDRIVGVPFFIGPVAEAVECHVQNGGYLVIPAAPALIKLNYDEEYRRAMQSADLALADSGLLVLLWRIATGRKINRISGINYFKHLLEQDAFRGGPNAFWIFQSETAKEKAANWLGPRGVSLDEKYFFIAAATPSSAQDYAILTRIEEEKPKHVVIAMAGGGQEKLALYLRDYLLYRPSIHCIGAALDLLSGEERGIPDWAERSHLGWLLRLFAQPRMLFPRIGIALALARMIFKYRSELPPLKKRWSDV